MKSRLTSDETVPENKPCPFESICHKKLENTCNRPGLTVYYCEIAVIHNILYKTTRIENREIQK